MATPHNTHAELCIKTMDAGKHTVTDKIMCMNTQEADAMIAARDRNGVMFSVFHNRRWDQDFLTIQKVIEDGLLGPVFLVESTVLGYGKPRGWRADKDACGGHLFDWGAHLADQGVLMAGCKPEKVYTTVQHRKWDITTESHHRTHVLFESGFEFSIELSRLTQIPKPRWRVYGEEGTLEKYGLDTQEKYMDQQRIEEAVDPPENYAKVKAIVDGEPKEMTIPTMKGDWLAYYRNISDVLNNGADLAVTAESVRHSVAIVDGAMKSAGKGRRGRLSSFRIEYPIRSCRHAQLRDQVAVLIFSGFNRSQTRRVVGRKGAMRAFARALRGKKSLGIIGNQDARDQGIFVEFFGRQSSCSPASGRLALEPPKMEDTSPRRNRVPGSHASTAAMKESGTSEPGGLACPLLPQMP